MLFLIFRGELITAMALINMMGPLWELLMVVSDAPFM